MKHTIPLSELFEELKLLLAPYQRSFVSKYDTDKAYDLWCQKDLVIDGRKRKEVYFTGLMIQSSYVGWYFMPVYTQAETPTIIQPELLKCLKGKSCFHIKELTPVLKKQIIDALEKGYALYRERGRVMN